MITKATFLAGELVLDGALLLLTYALSTGIFFKDRHHCGKSAEPARSEATAKR